MSDRQPYSRVYWSIRQDSKFRGIYSNDSHLAAWLRLLIAADATWPAPADIPANARKGSVTALAECGLVDLLGDGLFTIHGLQAERGRRQEAATRGASGTQAGPKRAADAPSRAGEAKTRRDELSQDEDEQMRAPDNEAILIQKMAQMGAYIRPESAMGQRIVRLVARRGAIVVMAELDRLAKSAPLSDRQIVFGLEEALDKIPTAVAARVEDIEEQRVKRSERVQSEAQARRIEAFRWTGKWDAETFGPEPEWDVSWGVRPA